MKISETFYHILFLLVLLTALMVSLGGCSDDHASPVDREAVVALLLGGHSSSVNADRLHWEDRVDELRMLAFGSAGEVVYNDLLSFPQGFDKPCQAIRLRPGVYDFCFIANESVGGSSYVEALWSVRRKSDFDADVRFRTLPYNPDFTPDGTSAQGRFLMSATYSNVPVLEGGTQANPLPLQLSDGRVMLLRSHAKVEVVFRKKEAGSTVPDQAVTALQLKQVTTSYAVPMPAHTPAVAETTATGLLVPVEFNYDADSIGSAVWYIPELLDTRSGTFYTELHINGTAYPVSTDNDNRVERNHHYLTNVYIAPDGGLELISCVADWNLESYKYMFQDENEIVTPPVTPTDSTLIIATDCGKIEMRSVNESLSQGLMGVYGDQIVWWDPVLQGPNVVKGEPPYYCEKKYGKGWRLINSCELMSFLRLFDHTYRVWQSNTWQGENAGLEFYSLPFRLEAQELLGRLTGADMSRYTLSDTGHDEVGGEKLGMLDRYFTPGDILERQSDYPDGWPFYGAPNNSNQPWYPMEVSIQIKGYWYADYLNPNVQENYDKILYGSFFRFDYSSTTSRCVRPVE
ncbi:MAG: hypothetical protein LBN24_10720 [Mediterranea sp.]|jgi:hypothetical protein|nr:hypothetical protein [Mediterranea sp.]